MFKAVALLITGSVIGAGAMFVVLQSNDFSSAGRNQDSVMRRAADFSLGRDERPEFEEVAVSERLGVYQAVAAETDLAELQAALETSAAAPWSPARDLQIDALLARLSELAPEHAVTVAVALGLETRFIADAFHHWAGVDSTAALRDLAALTNPVMRRAIALALLDVFGNDSAGVERIAAALPRADRAALNGEWLARRAEADPFSALREALAISDINIQRRALQQIAVVWAEQDPSGALSQADLLPDHLQSAYRVSVVDEWVRLDGAGYLAYLESVVSPPQEVVFGIAVLAGFYPELVLDVADRLTGNMGRIARSGAMQALAETDPDAALSRLSTMQLGSERETMMSAVGTALARKDPDAALAWAQSLSPPSPNLMTRITMAIAETDFNRALDFIDEPPAGVDPQLVMSVVTSLVARDPDRAEIIADQLVARDAIQAGNALRNLLGGWMQQDPEGALEWVLANGAGIDGAVLTSAARNLARSNPVAAAEYVNRIPQDYRSAWILQIAGPYALNDPQGAMVWAARYQGQEIYGDVLSQIVTSAAQVDARFAADLVTQVAPGLHAGAALQVASLWAQQEPRAAVQWSAALADPRARQQAIVASVSVWASTDASAAREFTLDLDRGETRDHALNSLISRVAMSGNLDRSLLNFFSSDQARQEALVRAIPLVSRNDAAEARELLRQVTNGTSRRQIEEQIELINAER